MLYHPRLTTILLLLLSSLTSAGVGPEVAQKIYDQVSPSLVAVQYTWENELRRQEIIGTGVVIGDDGLIVASIGVFYQGIPDDQMKDFKVIVPRLDADDLEL